MKNPFKPSKRKEGKVKTGSRKSPDVSNSSSNSSKGKSASVQSTKTPQHAKKSLASSSLKSAPKPSKSMTNSENGVGSGSNGSYSTGSPSSAKTETALNSKTKPQNEESGKNASAPLSANAESKPTDIYPTGTHDANSEHTRSQESKLYLEINPTEVFDEPVVMKSYNSIPVLEMTRLPRGGVSFETEAVGRVQFGIPPETIKDSMRLGLGIPAVYIVPVERFCREMGPALGNKRCTLIVDSTQAELNIRKVFSETLLGPAQFRQEKDPIQFEEEDFAPDFPRDAIPNFPKELKHFRIMPDGKELVLETLLSFCHFETPGESGINTNLGVPPVVEEEETMKDNERAPGQTSFVVDEEQAMLQLETEMNGSREPSKSWDYSQAKWIGEVATVYPPDATQEEINAKSTKRVEIFKMPGGTEYIMHDINEANIIVGRARFSGHVRVSESMSVDGFGGKPLNVEQSDDDEEENSDDEDESDESGTIPQAVLPPTFHPPSFGVTVLGNSHGFDKSGSVSGYVLWINGRGVMIDPPPYSSATLEREGIRPRTIVGIILTHCHADHDAGAFQKVLTGSPVVVITTPTIYKSFIRKYAALSALSPALLRHSHRHKPAIIGLPLRFQGATFHFTYTLHTIPCVGFRVEWRGRSMVFTGDHFNSPPAIDKLQEQGVLSKARADDLRHLPLQETDLLLHESGAPPIHTPLDVLLKLPPNVKKRLYVVHTSALPPGCELKAAPTGTAGTIRLDEITKPSSTLGKPKQMLKGSSINENLPVINYDEGGSYSSSWAWSEYSPSESTSFDSSANLDGITRNNNSFRPLPREVSGRFRDPPLVSLRPTSSTDAWFILNLLSSVPFLSSLSYSSTMEVLETARVDAFCINDIVVPSSRRNDVLCVVWEGTCMEREVSNKVSSESPSKTASNIRTSTLDDIGHGKHKPFSELDAQSKRNSGAVWHAGDWTGPRSLQPAKKLSGQSEMSATHDIVAMSSQGVKVITIEFTNLHAILKSGSSLYRKYLARQKQSKESTLRVTDLLDSNSAMRKLSAVQKRHLESLAVGPVSFAPGERLWQVGQPVDKAFILVEGTAAFIPKRRNTGQVRYRRTSGISTTDASLKEEDSFMPESRRSKEEDMEIDAMDVIYQFADNDIDDAMSTTSSLGIDMGSHHEVHNSIDGHLATSAPDSHDFARLSDGLQKRAESMKTTRTFSYKDAPCTGEDDDNYLKGENSDDMGLDEAKHETLSLDPSVQPYSVQKRRASRDRHTNKVLGRLFARRSYSSGLVFSRGHFFGDVSKMVEGLQLSGMCSEDDSGILQSPDDGGTSYGFGEKPESMANRNTSIGQLVIQEKEGDNGVAHNSTLAAGSDGCIVLYFPKESLIPFLDDYPGFLLSLLGTQVVV
eukprot:scaffold7218_cov52-Attheya_sp.AAC.5